MENEKIRGRLAPSPTGYMHLGNAFAFLMAYCSSRSQGGSLVLRIEDIDPERSREEYVRAILQDLAWLGIDWDEGPAPLTARLKTEGIFASDDLQDLLPSMPEGVPEEGACGPYRQSRCLSRYSHILQSFAERGLLYDCYCSRQELKTLASAPHYEDGSPVYPATCRGISQEQAAEFIAQGRRPTIRIDTEKALAALKQEGAVTCFSKKECIDLLAGGDFALMRSDGVPAYQLAVTADDAHMRITEVVRGNDLLGSTPRQKLLLALMHATLPSFVHIPLLYSFDGERLAKRHKSLELRELRSMGIRAESLIGYLGWLAGFLPSPRRITARELAKIYTPAPLGTDQLVLPEHFLSEMQDVPLNL